MGTRQQKFTDYEGFVEKFKPKKTTDDCYTPQPVYDAVVEYVDKHVYSLEGLNVVRPFWPGGDYQAYDYQPNDVVIDNPPFSILAQICRWYLAEGVHFFLFAPSLTLFGHCRNPRVTAVCAHAKIIYDNGAEVVTSFLTDMWPGCPIAVVDGDLCRIVTEASEKNVAYTKKKKVLKGKIYPDNLITSALMGKVVARMDGQWVIPRESAIFVSELDNQPKGRAIFGGGLLLSEKLTAERAAAERAAAERVERAAAERVELSEREKNIIKLLK